MDHKQTNKQASEWQGAGCAYISGLRFVPLFQTCATIQRKDTILHGERHHFTQNSMEFDAILDLGSWISDVLFGYLIWLFGDLAMRPFH